MNVCTVYVVIAADWWARAPAWIALLLAIPGVWFGWKAYQRNRDNDAEAKRIADSAALEWHVVCRGRDGRGVSKAPAALFVQNYGADAENLRIRLQRGDLPEMAFNCPLVRRGTPVLCGEVGEHATKTVQVDWHLYAQWTDGLGTHPEQYWHLTHIETTA